MHIATEVNDLCLENAREYARNLDVRNDFLCILTALFIRIFSRLYFKLHSFKCLNVFMKIFSVSCEKIERKVFFLPGIVRLKI